MASLRPLRRHSFLWILILGVVGVSAIAFYVAYSTEKLVETIAIEDAKIYSAAIEEFRTVYTSEVVSIVRRGHGIEVTHDYEDNENAIPLPATLSMLLGKRIGEHESGAETSLYSAYPFPWREDQNRERFRDPFSREAWKSLTENPETPFYRFEEVDGRRVLRYATADLMRASCVECHNTHPDTPRTGWKVGDVRGVLQVDLPLNTAIAASRAAKRSVITLVVVIGALALSGTWLFIARIRRSEAVLERAMLTDSAPVMIAYVDRDQRYLFANKTYRDSFGKTSNEMERMTVREVVGEEAYTSIGPNMDTARGGQSVVFETRIPVQGKGMGDVLATYTPDFDPGGAVRGVVVTVTDTTQVKALEQYLDSILLNLPVGVAILEGPEFRYFRINESLAKLNGLSVEGHLGKPLAEVLPDAAKSLLPILKPILETGKPVLGREFSITLPGSPDKPRHLVDYLFPITRTDGTPTAVGAVVVDVTASKQAERERARLSVAIDQTPEAIVITDTEGTIQFVNPAFERITGYTRAEAVGQNPRMLKSGEQDDAFYEDLWLTIGRGDTWNGRLVNRKKDGTHYTQEMVISPVRDASGRTVNFVAIQRDITDRLILERQLREAQKMDSVGRLAGGVAHDFNNMLGVILGRVEMAMDSLDPAQPPYAELVEIRMAAERSADLTRQLLAFARKQTIAPKVLSFNETVEGMLGMLRLLIGEDTELAWRPGQGVWTVRADPTQIDQILANLCVNARDAIENGGRITIETTNTVLDEAYCSNNPGSVPGEYVLLAVGDNGRGMDQQTLERLYEPFFTTKKLGLGTGLGLATVHGIVKQNGGFIRADSEPGHGTTFNIYWPRNAAVPHR